MSLFSDSFMREMEALDRSAMPGYCDVLRQTKTQDTRGGTTVGPWVAVNVFPIPCRVSSGSAQTSLRGEVLQQSADTVVYLSLTDLITQDVIVDNDDELRVSTLVNSGADPESVTERYRVTGKPVTPSYGTSLPVPAIKVG